ncbi:hypothetical protein L226DRAFT_531345 [Lentinus tigrinus ALCF2SS1-7]|nr:hypothetical protein L226DRAFT_531345 [Lentinus tigrinus ALCF2SS1-7]
MLLKTRVEGALRLCYSCHESQFDYDDFFRRLAAMLEEATVPSLTTLVIDIWTDSHPTPPGLSFLWSLPARLATLGVLGLDGRGLLLPFMASADGKQALQSLKRLYLTWDASLPAPMPAHYQDPTQPHATIERSPDAASTGDSNAVTGAPPPRAPDAVPYGPQACEAFCDVLAPVLTMQPYTGSLEILHVLLVKPASKSSRKDAPAVDLGAVQEQLSGRLGHLVRVGVCWYDPEEDYESAVGVS